MNKSCKANFQTIFFYYTLVALHFSYFYLELSSVRVNTTNPAIIRIWLNGIKDVKILLFIPCSFSSTRPCLFVYVNMCSGWVGRDGGG